MDRLSIVINVADRASWEGCRAANNGSAKHKTNVRVFQAKSIHPSNDYETLGISAIKQVNNKRRAYGCELPGGLMHPDHIYGEIRVKRFVLATRQPTCYQTLKLCRWEDPSGRRHNSKQLIEQLIKADCLLDLRPRQRTDQS